MAITYPLPWPTPHRISEVAWAPRSVVAENESPFTVQTERFVHQGMRLACEVTVHRTTERAIAETFIAFFLSLNGMEGTFRFGDPAGASPRGSASGAPVVDGAGQSGRTLAARGWTASAAGVLLAGDWIEVESWLYKVLTDTHADGLGKATLDIWPRLRTQPADGATITTSAARGTFRLATNTPPWRASRRVFWDGFTVPIVEAV